MNADDNLWPGRPTLYEIRTYSNDPNAIATLYPPSLAFAHGKAQSTADNLGELLWFYEDVYFTPQVQFDMIVKPHYTTIVASAPLPFDNCGVDPDFWGICSMDDIQVYWDGAGMSIQSNADAIVFITQSRFTGILPPSPTPEPATWAMLIAGFGAVGAVVRRRRYGPPLVLN